MIAPRNSEPLVRDHVEEPDDRPSALVVLDHMEEEGWPNDQRLGNDGIRRFLERRVIKEISVPAASAIAKRHGVDHADAEDLIQIAWIELLERWATFTPNEIRDRIQENPRWLKNGFRYRIRRRAIDGATSRSGRPEISLDGPSDSGEDESGGTEEGGEISDPRWNAPFDTILIRSEVDWLAREIVRHLRETTSPKNRSRVRRWVSLLRMDLQWHREQGVLPSTKEVIQRLKFPSASTVSQVRARYHQAARDIRAQGEWA